MIHQPGHLRRRAAVVLCLGALCAAVPRADTAPLHRERFIFAGDRGHVHASSIIETPDGSLLAVWYESGTPDDAYYFRRRSRTSRSTSVG